jgi:hypothetical protein
MCADSASVVPAHDEISIFSPGRAPTVSNYPFLVLCLTDDGDGMAEGILGTVSKGIFLHLGVLG